MKIDDLKPEEIEVVEENVQPSLSIDDIDPSEIEEVADTSVGESVLRGAAQGVSLGFADEISGAVESAFTEKTYEQARDESRAAFEKARQDNPIAFTSGDVAGSIVSTIGSGGAGAGIKGAIALGTIAGVGLSEEDSIEGQLTDAFIGGTLGAVGEKAGKIFGAAGHRASKSLKSFANSEADALGLRAIGVFTKGARNKLARKLDSKNMKVEDFVGRLQSEVDTEGNPLLKLTSSQEDLLTDLIERKDQLGDQMGAILKQVDVEAGASNRLGTVDPKELADHLEIEVLEPLLNSPNVTFEEQQLATQVAKRIQVLKDSKYSWDMTQLNNWKSKVADSAKFLKKQNSDLELHSKLRRVVSKTNDFIHDKVQSISNNPDTLAEFKEIKRKFGVLADSEEFLEDSVQASKEGLTGSIRKALGMAAANGGATVAGGVLGGIPGAALGAALTVASKSPKTNAALSSSLRRVGKSLSDNPANAEYINILMQGAARGTESFNKAIEIVDMKTQGLITSIEEAEQLKSTVLQSNAKAREKRRQIGEINQGRVPTQPSEPERPFFRQYSKRNRSAGKKDTEL